jgi:hypothetical protein
MTYDTWKAHNPADDELGSRSQPDQEHEPTPGPGTGMSASTDLAILLNECIDQRRRLAYDLECSKEDVRELSELNAELLEALKKLDSVSPPLTCVKTAIAKAEALK